MSVTGPPEACEAFVADFKRVMMWDAGHGLHGDLERRRATRFRISSSLVDREHFPERSGGEAEVVRFKQPRPLLGDANARSALSKEIRALDRVLAGFQNG